MIPFRRDRRGETGLEVVLGEVPADAAGEQRGHGGKNSADQARALCGKSGHLACATASIYGPVRGIAEVCVRPRIASSVRLIAVSC